jgi:hypothetical protein
MAHGHCGCYFQLKRVLFPQPEGAGCSDDFLLSRLPQIGHTVLLGSGLLSNVLPHLLHVYFSSAIMLSPPYHYRGAYSKYKLTSELLQLAPRSQKSLQPGECHVRIPGGGKTYRLRFSQTIAMHAARAKSRIYFPVITRLHHFFACCKPCRRKHLHRTARCIPFLS